MLAFSFLFLLAVDWIMKQVTLEGRTGIQWTLTSHLEDLDFADDLALLSHSHNHMQEKTDRLDKVSKSVGLNIHSGKTKILRINTTSDLPITLRETPLEEVDSFMYLGSTVNREGGTDEDIRVRIQKARGAFIMLRNIWKSKVLRKETKLRIFRSNVKSVLLYGSESWKLNESAKNRLQVFINKCLRQILGIRWFDLVTTEDLLTRANEQRVEEQIICRRWRWIGHTLRRPDSNIEKGL